MRVTWTDGLSVLQAPWAAYRSIDETPNLVLLKEGDVEAKVIPKRAFGQDAPLDSFRALLKAMITDRPTGFPVMPLSPSGATP